MLGPRLFCVSLPKSYYLEELVLERTIRVLIYGVWAFTGDCSFDLGIKNVG